MKTKIRKASGIPVLLALMLASGAAADAFSQTVMIPVSVRFGSVAASAGVYQVAASPDGSLSLQPLRGGRPFRIAAVAGKHGARVNEPVAVAFEADRGIVHVLMLSPDGRQLEAIGTSGAATARRVRPTAARIDYEVRQAASRVMQSRLASGMRMAAQSRPQRMAAADATRTAASSTTSAAQAAASAAEAERTENPVEYIFRVPVNFNALPDTHQSVMIHAMLATTPLDGMLPSGNGRAVGWGQVSVELPPGGRLQTTVNLPVDWYGPGPEGDVPFPKYYYVAVIGFAACGSDVAWHEQARCGTPFRPLVTGKLPP